MAMRTFMKSEAASPRVGRPDSIRGRVALSGARATRPRGTPPIQIEGKMPSLRGKPRASLRGEPRAPCRPGRLRAALSFTAALAVAAALGGCSTFGVSPSRSPSARPSRPGARTPPSRRRRPRRKAATAPPPACASPAPRRGARRTRWARTLRARPSRPPSTACPSSPSSTRCSAPNSACRSSSRRACRRRRTWCHPAPHQPGAAAPVLQHRPAGAAGVRRRHPRAGRGARLPRHPGDRIRRSP